MQVRSKTDFNLEEYISVICEVIGSGGEFRLFPRGTSMLPLIRQGIDSVVLVAPVKKLKKRDIVFYKRENGQFVLHRIVGISKDGTYILCGDNQTTLEYGISSDMIIASVTAVYRGEKRVENSRFGRGIYELLWCFMPFRKILFFFRKILSKIKGAFIKK